jgi:hypothetical protein
MKTRKYEDENAKTRKYKDKLVKVRNRKNTTFSDFILSPLLKEDLCLLGLTVTRRYLSEFVYDIIYHIHFHSIYHHFV